VSADYTMVTNIDTPGNRRLLKTMVESVEEIMDGLFSHGPNYSELLHEFCAQSSGYMEVGSLSTLKAALSGDTGYIPDPIEKLTEVLGDGMSYHIINKKLIEEALKAYDVPNTSLYYDNLIRPEVLREFMEARKGHLLMCFNM
jgi:hypothetical protein